jgi:hypothetical protein
LQDLHFQTKLASPRLPCISFASCLIISPVFWNISKITYKAVYIDKVWVDLSTRATLDFEGVPERVIRRIIRSQVRHAMKIGLSDVQDLSEEFTDPVRSAVRVRVNILVVVLKCLCL